MKFVATKDNVIIRVEKVIKSPDELLIEEDKEKEKILMGTVAAAGPECHPTTANTLGVVCAYKSRVAMLPWQTDDHEFYVVKEENIYGILEP